MRFADEAGVDPRTATDAHLMLVPNMGKRSITALTAGLRAKGGRILFVGRHKAAIEFCFSTLCAGEAGPTGGDWILSHVSRGVETSLARGDTVVGILPIQIVARLSGRGVRCLILIMDDLPPALRGIELSTEQMRRVGAKLVEYRAEVVT